jgi:hypothetical protein
MNLAWLGWCSSARGGKRELSCGELVEPVVEPRIAHAFRYAFALIALTSVAAETLHNGIELPAKWPPNYLGKSYKEFFNDPALRWHEPMPVPYLERPPAVIPIDVGRQLFVDDFLIENTQLRRTWHTAEYHPASPLIRPDRPWEHRADENVQWAMPFPDGVWFDARDQLFKLWYLGPKTFYATSKDGIRWEKPSLDVVPGTNIIIDHQGMHRDAGTVWLDHDEPDPAKRFKMWFSRAINDRSIPGNSTVLDLCFSPDGIHWSKPGWTSGPVRDLSTVYRDPFRNVWVHSIKLRPTLSRGAERQLPFVRSRAYLETRDILAPWDDRAIVPWMGADKLDLNRNSTIGRQVLDGQHLYNFNAVAYESVMLGFTTIFHDDGTGPQGKWHHNDTTLAFSRDGFHFDRTSREPFLGAGHDRKGWNWTNVQPVGGGCVVMGDKLYFYCSGRNNEVGTTGLAVLRRDGFASMDAAETGGEMITRPVMFSGQHLFVNANVAGGGELRVSILQEDLSDFHNREPKTIGGFTAENCEPVRADSTIQRVTWKGAKDLSGLAGRPVRFRFHLRKGSLYSFWVSPDETGASRGYVAAGGPGYPATKDTVGAAAYEAARRIAP